MKENNIGYGSVNHPVDHDPVCGYTGIINDECRNAAATKVMAIPILSVSAASPAIWSARSITLTTPSMPK